MLLLLCILLIPTDEEIANYIAFTKLHSATYDYAATKAVEVKKPLIVWVNVDDYTLYETTLKADVLHVFVKSFPGMDKGVVIGKPTANGFVRDKDITTNIKAELHKYLFKCGHTNCNCIDCPGKDCHCDQPAPQLQFVPQMQFDPRMRQNCVGSS